MPFNFSKVFFQLFRSIQFVLGSEMKLLCYFLYFLFFFLHTIRKKNWKDLHLRLLTLNDEQKKAKMNKILAN